MSDVLLLETRERRAVYFHEEAVLLEKLSHGQQPKILYVGSSDSRAMPSRILGAIPGTAFVVRTIANIVPPYEAQDRSVGAVLEYAILHLQVSHIVICGNSLCGILQFLTLPPDEQEPCLSAWLDHARPTLAHIPAGLKGRERLEALIEANVLLQAQHVLTYPCVKDALARGALELHRWVYDFKSGLVRAYDEMVGIFIEEPPFEQ